MDFRIIIEKRTQNANGVLTVEADEKAGIFGRSHRFQPKLQLIWLKNTGLTPFTSQARLNTLVKDEKARRRSHASRREDRRN